MHVHINTVILSFFCLTRLVIVAGRGSSLLQQGGGLMRLLLLKPHIQAGNCDGVSLF